MKLLLDKLYSKGIRLELLGDELKIKAPKGALNQELIQEIKLHKLALIDLLSHSESKIPKAPNQEFYPLTASQKRMWILSQFEGGKNAYNITVAFEMLGVLDVEALEKAFLYLIRRHDSLRTAFVEKDGEVFQKIKGSTGLTFKIDTIDSEKDESVSVREFSSIEFDLDTAPLLKARLIKTSENRNILLCSIHHIIGDGWSLEVFSKELLICYNAISKQKEVDLPALRIQYQDYTLWLRSQSEQKKIADSKAYWIEKFKGNIPVLELPSFKQRPAIQTFNGKWIRKEFSQEISSQLNEFSKTHGTTLFMTLMAAINSLLFRYTNQKDIVIGTPIAGRENLELENQIGLFLNTLALRTKIGGNETFMEILQQEKQLLLEAYEHQKYPFDELVSELSLKRDTSRNVLFDVMVVLNSQNNVQNISSNDHKLDGIQTNRYELERNTSLLDLRFTFFETEVLSLELEYNTDIYDDILINRIFDHLENLIKQVLQNPNVLIKNIDLLEKQESIQILKTFNDTAEDFSEEKTIVDLFEQQAIKTPKSIAVEFEGKQLSYEELDHNANQLAHYLRETYAIRPDDLIGIKLERSEQLLVAILAILKSGAAYVPIDINFPEERINFIQEDSKCKVVIDKQSLDYFRDIKSHYSVERLQKIVEPNNLAYVIYTSGTTGNPKGVMIMHRNVLALIYWAQSEFDSEKIETVYASTSHCFDLSVYEMFYPLSIGKKIKILTNALDIGKVLPYDEKVLINTVPSSIRNLLDTGVSLDNASVINLAGEALSIDIANRLLKSKAEIRNLYGPSEDTTYSTIYKLSPNNIYKESVPVGKPIANTQCYILDSNFKPLPIGVSGKLYVAGAGVTKGYLNKPDLTATRFLTNPFLKGALMYDTGDIVKWLPDGNIEFLGRDDFQLKIRGYRIESRSIESVISSFSDDIGEVVVAAKIVQKEKELVAYYISKSPIDRAEFKQFLSKKLPSYMIPNFYVCLDIMPLTPNGKVDIKNLPEIDPVEVNSTKYIKPESEIERGLSRIWSEVLKIDVDKIGLNDDFFALGGHSLKATTLISKVYKSFGVKITIQDIFTKFILSEQAELIQSSESKTFLEIPAIAIEENYELSSTQKRLWILDQFDFLNNAYDIPVIFEFNEVLDLELLKKSFDYLISRHESLRTIFKEDEVGNVRQWILPVSALDFNLNYEDLFDSNATNKTVEIIIKEELAKVFDLKNGPLLRAKVIRTEKGKYIFIFVMHHIICDAWSMNVLLKDLMTFYHGFTNKTEVKLPKLRIQYKDYAAWQQSELKTATKAREYWLDQFGEDSPVLNLPLDFVRPPIQTFSGETAFGTIEASTVSKLKTYVHDQGATLFMGLLSATKILLYKYTNQTDITLGTPIAGREHSDLSDQIGFYANTLALRSQFESSSTFKDILQGVKDLTLNAYEHQTFPFDELVDSLDLKRDTSRNPLFDVHINLLNTGKEDFEFELKGKFVPRFKNESSKFDLTFTFAEDNGRIGLALEYNTDLFTRDTIERLRLDFIDLLDALLLSPNQSIENIDSERGIYQRHHFHINGNFTTDLLKPSIQVGATKLYEKPLISFGGYNQVLQELNNPISNFHIPNTYNVILIKWNECYRDSDSERIEDKKNLVRSYKDSLVASINSYQSKNDNKILIISDSQLGYKGELRTFLSSVETDLFEALNGLPQVTIAKFNDIIDPYALDAVYDKHANEQASIPYTKEVFNILGIFICKSFYTATNATPKVLVLDCDNTLWKGVLGEDGSEGLDLSNHKKFHSDIKDLKAKGFLLALASKNNENEVLDYINSLDNHLYLGLDDVVNHKINWSAKSGNIREIANELNLGLDSFVFLDDSKVECAEVRQNAPEVLTLEMPQSLEDIESLIPGLLCFEKKTMTKEDGKRTEMYKQDSERQEDQKNSTDYYGFVESLNVTISIDRVADDQLDRASQLTQRTNQFNAKKVPYSIGELRKYREDHNKEVYIIDVNDKYGSYGLAGLVMSHMIDNKLVIETFLLSCRVLGRGVEYQVLRQIGEKAKSIEVDKVEILCQENKKNQPIIDFFVKSGFEKNLEGYLTTPNQLSELEIKIEEHQTKKKKSSSNEIDRKRYNERFLKDLCYNLSTVEKINEAVDKVSTIAIDRQAIATEYVAPASLVEKELAAIWSEVLKVDVEKIGLHDDFFVIGGHSLKATILTSRVLKTFGIKMSIVDVFSKATIYEQSQLIQDGSQEYFNEIQKLGSQESFILSSGQRRLWVLSQFESVNNAYNIPLVAEFKEELDLDIVKKAFDQLISRHESLRTVFREDDNGNVRQWVLPATDSKFILAYEDINQLGIDSNPIEHIIQAEINKGFDLVNGPLFRAKLIRTHENKLVFVFVMHHIISDGWSMNILVRDLMGYYNGIVNNVSIDLPELRIQYKDYAAWQQSELEKEEKQDRKQYWIEQFDGTLPILNMPLDYNRPAIQTFNGNELTGVIDAKSLVSLKKISQQSGGTLFMGLMTVVNTLLYKYTGQTDIIIGTPIAGRNHADLSDQIGFYVNTLALRSQFDGSDCFNSLLKNIKNLTLKSFENQDYPFDELIDNLDLIRDTSRNPLFDVMVALQNNERVEAEETIKNLFVSFHNNGAATVSKFDLSFDFTEGDDELFYKIEYNSDLFKEETISRLSNHLQQILQALVNAPDESLENINYINTSEQTLIIDEFNNTENEYSRNKTINQLFEEQVKRTPSKMALEFESESLTYTEFNEHANQLARQIRKEYKSRTKTELVPGTLIGVYLERSLEMVIGLMAILKAGGAYVPIDPEYPKDRINHILEDTNSQLILTQLKFEDSVPVASDRLMKIDLTEDFYKKEDASNLNRISGPEDLAYVIFTSGTTGKPKGAKLCHTGIVNRVEWMQNMYSIGGQDVVLQKTPYVFDVSVWEFFWAHWYGAKLVLAIPGGHKDCDYLHDIIERQGVTTLHFVPSMLEVYNNYLIEEGLKFNDSIRQIICSGEALGKQTVVKAYQNSCSDKFKLHNLYGPTEASIDVTYYETSPEEEVFIGKPIQNTKLYILDSKLNPVPVGILGELYIGGVGLAKGYLNREELTIARFVNNPFANAEDKINGLTKIYKTGDVVRWMPDGNIEYIGRNDNQVKIRGHRIELGEIQNAIENVEGVRQSCVLVKKRETSEGEVKYIAGYYVKKESATINEQFILDQLSRQLPESMVPSIMVVLDEFPLTTNGKLDTRSLPDPELNMQEEYFAPQSDLEEAICKIWEAALGLDKVSINDDFFRIGGDSILSIQVASKIRQIGYTAHPKDIYENRTVRNLSEFLLLRSYDDRVQSEQGLLVGEVPLLPIQKWFLENVKDGTFSDYNHWNQSFTIKVPELDEEQLENAIRKLVDYHDVFRIHLEIDKEDHSWKQFYNEKINLPALKSLDIKNLAEQQISTELTTWQNDFDLETGPVFRIGYLFGFEDGSARIFVAMHHMIVDGVSWRIIANDLESLYNGGILPEKGSSYRQWGDSVYDYALTTPQERLYWDDQVNRIPDQEYNEGNSHQEIIHIDEDDTKKLLQEAPNAYNTEINELLLTALAYALQDLNRHGIQGITLEGHGREDIDDTLDLSQTVGWFTTMYPIILEVKNSISESIKTNKDELRRIPNKGLNFGVFATHPVCDFGYKDLPPISFNYFGQFNTNESNWSIVSGEGGKTISSENKDKNVININGGIENGKLMFSVNTRLGQDSTIKLSKGLKYHLITIITHCVDALENEGSSNTPSDFSSVNISQGLLDKLQNINSEE